MIMCKTICTKLGADKRLILLTLHVSFSYEEDQEPYRMRHGSAFYLDAQIRLVRP